MIDNIVKVNHHVIESLFDSLKEGIKKYEKCILDTKKECLQNLANDFFEIQ